MALLFLIVLGATIGWLASIITRNEAAREVGRQIAVGVVATLIVGIAANSGTILGGLSIIALGASVAAGAAALVIYHAVVKKNIQV